MSRNEPQGGPTKTTWSKDELREIAEADDLHISPFREDGVTYGTPTWIRSVAVDDALHGMGRESLADVFGAGLLTPPGAGPKVS